jgi:hypothetical protein
MKAQLVPKSQQGIKKPCKALLSKENKICKGQSAGQPEGTKQAGKVQDSEP